MIVLFLWLVKIKIKTNIYLRKKNCIHIHTTKTQHAGKNKQKIHIQQHLSLKKILFGLDTHFWFQPQKRIKMKLSIAHYK